VPAANLTTPDYSDFYGEKKMSTMEKKHPSTKIYSLAGLSNACRLPSKEWVGR
jgi:hypothetical protein